MGASKNRKAAYAQAKQRLMADLAGDEAVVAETAVNFFERFVFPKRYTGGCYLVTMFLQRFLKEEKAVAVTPVVGYVNDGTDDVMISHAWLELNGLKTDVTLHLTEYPESQLPGALLILDRQLLKGQVEHSYHREQTPAGYAENQRLALGSLRGMIAHKDAEHAYMSECMTDPARMAAHQAKAPPGLRYDDMRAVLV